MNKFFHKIYFNFFFPTVDLINLDSRYGIFSSTGIDTYVLAVLYNVFTNKSNSTLVEINRPHSNSLSFFNLYLPILSNFNFLIFGENKLFSNKSTSIDSVRIEIDPCDFIYSPHLKFGESFMVGNDVYNIIRSNTSNITLLSFCFTTVDIIEILDIINKKSVASIIIYDNPILKKESKLFRDKLISLGYVFFSRIDSSHDFFILSDCINGFPSECFKRMPMSNLARWISLPSNSNYTKPV